MSITRNIYNQPRWDLTTFVRGNALVAMRDAVLAALYPGGVLSTGADDVTVITGSRVLPSGCSAVVEYTFDSNGGRAVTPIYAEVLVPSIASIGKALIFCDGHRAYRWDEEANPLLTTALAAGVLVIMCEMPNFGRQAGGSTEIIVDGESYSFALHVLTAEHDGGPAFSRLFSDQPVRAMNQVALPIGDGGYGIEKFAIVGFSGGGQACRLAQIAKSIPRRYGIFDFLPPPFQAASIENDGCIETSDLVTRAALGNSMRNLDAVSAAAGTVSWTIEGINDSPWNVRSPETMSYWQEVVSEQLRGTGSSFRYLTDYSAQSHDISQWAATAIVNDIVANL